MRLVAYVNQPIFQLRDQFYTSHTNFVDFMCFWANRSKEMSLVIPVQPVETLGSNCVGLKLNERDVVPAKPYKSHFGALWTALFNYRVVLNTLKNTRPKLNSASQEAQSIVLILPGPSMMLALLSYFLSKHQKLAIFVRGNSLKTVEHMYQGKIIKPMVMALSTFFRRRLNMLQSRGAVVFCFGDELRDEYSIAGASYSIAPLIEESMIVTNRPATLQVKSMLTLLFVGRLSQEKGIIELLEAAKILRNQGAAFKLLIAGHGPLENSVVQQISKNQLDDCVEFIGRLTPGTEVIEAMDKADLLIVPSKTEGVPRVIAEALARNVAVLSTRVGGIPGAFGTAIEYLDGGSPSEIADCLAKLISTAESPAEKSLHGNQIASRYTFESNISLIESSMHKHFS